MTDNVQIISTADRGLGLAAVRPAEKYALIMKEHACLGVVDQEHVGSHCSGCFRPPGKFGLKPCASCKHLYYCSEKCQRKDWDLHGSECLLFRLLERLPFPLMRLTARALFRAKENPGFISELSQLVTNVEHLSSELLTHFGQWARILIKAVPFSLPPGITEETIIRISCALKSNAFCPANEEGMSVALQYFSIASRLNHSCRPNAEYASTGRTLRLVALEPIKEGEEITISYVNRLLPKAERQAFLRENFFFACACPACKEAEEEQPVIPAEIPLVLEGLARLTRLCPSSRSYALAASSLAVTILGQTEPPRPEIAHLVLTLLVDDSGQLRTPITDLAKRIDMLTVAAVCALVLGKSPGHLESQISQLKSYLYGG